MKRLAIVALGGVVIAAAVVQVIQANRRDPVRPMTAAINDSFPTVRSPTAWPFTWSSIWNMPIGNEAKLVATPVKDPGSIGIEENIVILQPTAPTISIIGNTSTDPPSANLCSSVIVPKRELFVAPVPFLFSTVDNGLAGPKNAAVFLAKDGRTVLQAGPFARCPDGTATAAKVAPIDDIVSGSGERGSRGMAETSALGGTLRVDDLRPGSQIRHALQIELGGRFLRSPAKGATSRWPAAAVDPTIAGQFTGTNAALEVGSLVTLPASFRVDKLKSEPARIVAQAMKDYGAYVVDGDPAAEVAFSTEWGPAGRTADRFKADYGFAFASNSPKCVADCDWRQDLRSVLLGLAVVADNGPTTVGGRGARRVPCAPAFADGSGGAPPGCELHGLVRGTRTIRVMPIGDSLTEGGGVGGHVSYRADLYKRLVEEGYPVDFVGSQNDAAPGVPDPNNEGHGGFTIGPDTNRFCTRETDGTASCNEMTFNISDHVDDWLTAAKPDVVLLLIGVNDNFTDPVAPGASGIVRTQSPADAPAKLAALVTKIRSKVPGSVVIVASLIPTPLDVVWPAVPQLRSSAESLAALSDGRVRFADIASVVLDPQDYVEGDQIHLSASGAAKVAEGWLVPLRSVLDELENSK